MRKLVFTIILAGLLALSAKGQQQNFVTQYMFTPFLFNPAATASEGYHKIGVIAREQWVGIKAAPKYHALSGEFRLLGGGRAPSVKSASGKGATRYTPSGNGRMGLGGFIYDDRVGTVSKTGMQASYAFYVPGNDYQLSFGLSLAFYQMRMNKDDLVVTNPDDPVLVQEKSHMLVPDVNIGAYFMHSNVFGGLSATNMFQSSLKIGKYQIDSYKTNQHFYGIVGGVIPLGYKVQLEPSMFSKFTPDIKLSYQNDFSLKVLFENSYWGGLSYRTNNDLVIYFGFSVDAIDVGYAFDYPLTNLGGISFGTHELLVQYSIGRIISK